MVNKGYRHGTDRLVAPAVTLARLRPHLASMGITRLANVTGLDVIGVPVVMAVRPNSRSLAVAQGKGLTLEAAKVSAAMEAAETYHAEHITLPLTLGSSDELRGAYRLIDTARLHTGASGPFRPDRQALWVKGTDVVCDEPVWVPFDAVHTDLTFDVPVGRRMIDTTSNGLASGNHLLEAISHALCELIERDAATRWWRLPPDRRRETRVDLATIDDAGCRTVLDLLAAAEVTTAAWELTSGVGLAVFRCSILENPHHAVLPLAAAEGFGCHPRREIALLRALTEAVQSRLTFISGSRDDMFRVEYERFQDRRTLNATWSAWTSGVASRSFQDAPTHANDTFDEDLSVVMEGLRAVGIDEVAIVDLTRPEFGISVVRAVVPGLVFDESVVHGTRAPVKAR